MATSQDSIQTRRLWCPFRFISEQVSTKDGRSSNITNLPLQCNEYYQQFGWQEADSQHQQVQDRERDWKLRGRGIRGRDCGSCGIYAERPIYNPGGPVKLIDMNRIHCVDKSNAVNGMNLGSSVNTLRSQICM